MSVQTESIRKQFGAFTALDQISLEIASGELVALLGPSGCGKTTLLRIMAGLEYPDSGRVVIDGQDHTGVHPRDRRVGFVFQHYALFRHMTVFENVAFGLRVQPSKVRPRRDEISLRVHELLELVHLDNQGNKYPDQLSGGQRQRVALARSLIVNPGVLLLDEPFGALDANVRKDLRRWLRRLQKDLSVTTILVTHDQEEALEVADRVVLMNRGRIEQIGTPEQIYMNPANEFVYRFLGAVNVFHARIKDEMLVRYDVNAPAANAVPGVRDETDRAADVTKVLARPYDVRISRERSDDAAIVGTIGRITFSGPHVRLEIEPDAGGEGYEVSVPVEQYKREQYRSGERVFVSVADFMVFMGEGI